MPARKALPTDCDDPLADLLSRIRLSGARFVRRHHAPPWTSDVIRLGEADGADGDGGEWIVLHAVRSGDATIWAAGECLRLTAGDIAILPRGDAHRLGSGDDEASGPADIVFGALRCERVMSGGLFRQLPRLFRVHPSGCAAELLKASIGHMLEESSPPTPGTAALRHRLPELLLIEIVRLHAEQAPLPTGWLAADADPVVRRALRLLHSQPAHRWTAVELAQRVATSRSVLSDRFRRLLGRSPISYVTETRMQLAASLMRGSTLKLEDIAERAGYGSQAAFSRAFRRHTGVPPSRWRTLQVGP